jgi:hypothetical protein
MVGARESLNSRYRVQTRCGFFLCRLGDGRKPFCILTVAETDGGRLAMAAWYGQPLATVSGSFDDPPVARIG